MEASASPVNFVDKSAEVTNIVEMIGFAALSIRTTDKSIYSMNASAEELLQLDPNERNGSIENFGDQALKLNLLDLVEQSIASPSQMVNSQLAFSGINHTILASAIMGSEEPDYIIVTLIPDEGA